MIIDRKCSISKVGPERGMTGHDKKQILGWDRLSTVSRFRFRFRGSSWTLNGALVLFLSVELMWRSVPTKWKIWRTMDTLMNDFEAGQEQGERG